MSEILATYNFVSKSDGYYASCNNASVCTKAVVPSTYLGETVFYVDGFKDASALKEVIIQPGVKRIGSKAFYNCVNLEKVSMPSTIQYIESFVFSLCKSLKRIVIPESVESIGSEAFSFGHSMQELYFLGRFPCPIDDELVFSGSDTRKFYCYSDAFERYKTSTNWNAFADQFIADDVRLTNIASAMAQKEYFVSKDDLRDAVAETSFDAIKTAIFDAIYPVGSIYMSMNSTSPSTLFGGNWKELENHFLLGASSKYAAGTTGGDETVALTEAQLASHTHDISDHYHYNYRSTLPSHDYIQFSGGAHSHPLNVEDAANDTTLSGDEKVFVPYDATETDDRYVGNTWYYDNQGNLQSDSGTHSHSIDAQALKVSGLAKETGSNEAHNNMPPYLAVYMWKRVP